MKHKSNLFNKTERVLTWKYSFLILLFLLLFIILLYAIVYFSFTSNLKNELRENARHETNAVNKYLKNGERGNRSRTQQFEVMNSDQLFYFVTNSRGEIMVENEQLPLLQATFIHLLADWQPKQEEIRKEKISIDKKQYIANDREFSTYMPNDPDLQVLMIAKPIYERNQLVGYLYIGHNATSTFQLLHSLLWILGMTTVIFTGIAFYFSRVMSKRAMIPIERAFTRQQEFVADASHELRTPLSVMLSSLELLEMEEDRNNEMSERTVTNLKGEVKRMTSLVSHLLTLARSDSNQHALTIEEVNLYSIADQAVHSFYAHAEARKMKLELRSPPTLTMYGNKELLTQLLYIFIDNAMKYSSDGGLITLTIVKEGSHVQLSVQDTGIGIEEKDIPYLFERFYRVDKARTRQQGGHGLGLSIAKWIVETHGGQITVKSKLGEGSTFIASMPIEKRK